MLRNKNGTLNNLNGVTSYSFKNLILLRSDKVYNVSLVVAVLRNAISTFNICMTQNASVDLPRCK